MIVNSEIFATVLFSRTLTDAKFREKIPSRNGEITLTFTDVGESRNSQEVLRSQIWLLWAAKALIITYESVHLRRFVWGFVAHTCDKCLLLLSDHFDISIGSRVLNFGLSLLNASSEWSYESRWRIQRGFRGFARTAIPRPKFLSIPWKWNNLVLERPNYFIFIRDLRKMR